MRAARTVAAIAAAALVALGCSACRDNLAGPASDDSTSSSSGGGGAQATTDLNGIQSTLDSIQSDMAGDGSP